MEDRSVSATAIEVKLFFCTEKWNEYKFYQYNIGRMKEIFIAYKYLKLLILN